MFLMRKPEGEPIEVVIKFTHQSAREFALSMLEVLGWEPGLRDNLIRAMNITEGKDTLEDGEELIIVRG